MNGSILCEEIWTEESEDVASRLILASLLEEITEIQATRYSYLAPGIQSFQVKKIKSIDTPLDWWRWVQRSQVQF